MQLASIDGRRSKKPFWSTHATLIPVLVHVSSINEMSYFHKNKQVNIT